MSELFTVLAILIAYVSVRNKCSPVLPLLISFEFSLSHLVKSMFVDLDMYSIDNMPLILISRMLILLPAAYIIIKHRINLAWSIVGLIYSGVFLYNGLTLVQLSSSDDGFFMSNYSLFMRLSMIVLMICLAFHSWGGGIKNYLDSRLYFIASRSNVINPTSKKVFDRINRIWSRS